MADRTVGGLYLSLGLDISELEAGFAVADRTMNQALARFNSEAAQIKIKTNIDTLKAEDDLGKLKAQFRGLGEEIDVLRKKELLLQRDFEATNKALGADNALTRKAGTNLLKQQQAIALLESRQRDIGKTIDTVSSPWFQAAEAINAAKGGVKGLTAYLAKVAPALAGLTTAVGAGGAIALITKDAADAAAAIGDLGDKFGMTKEQAAQLMGTTKAAGVDTEGFVSWLTRLDKTVTSAGEAGNETTRTLSRFGVSLTDGTGKLLTYNQQLARLAEGYKNAQAVGKTEEFLSGLGRGAAQFADLLNKYDSEYAQRGRERYSKPLLDAVEPSQVLTDKLNKIDEQLISLREAFGAVFIPVAAEMVPEVVKKLQDLRFWIDENSEALEKMAKVGAAGAGGALNGLTLPFTAGFSAIPDAYHRLFDSAEEAAARRAKEAEREARRAAEASATPTREQRAAEQQAREAEAAAAAERKAEEENARAIEDIWRKATASKLENDLAAIDSRMKKELEAANLTEEARARIYARYGAEREATLYKANQEMERMNRDLSDSIAKQTQGELENALRGIDRQAEAMRKKYTDLFGGLSEETNALIQQNANLQKQQAVQSRADKALTSEKKYWDIFQQAMNGGMLTERHRSGLKFYTMTGNMTQEERLKAAEDAIRKQMMRERGITSADVKTSDLTAFDEIMKRLQGGGLANVIDDAGLMSEKVSTAVSQSLEGASAQMAEGMNSRLAPALESLSSSSNTYQSAALNEYQSIRQSIEELAAKIAENKEPPTITVQIESAVTEDSAAMTHLADTVADRISEVITQYVGSTSNTY